MRERGRQGPNRPAWVEIDLPQLRRNFEIINRDKPGSLQIMYVVKDQAYGHGAVEVAKAALSAGVRCLAVATVSEALELREKEIAAPIFVFGERTEEELQVCLDFDLICFINHVAQAKRYAKLARAVNKKPIIHIEIDTGLSRYGVRWTQAFQTIEAIATEPHLKLAGIMSHFAMSDEADKSFALQQLDRFESVLKQMKQKGIEVGIRHMCNTGGYLDLPQAHFDLVRLGILPLGVYPSQVCRRIPGLRHLMSVKTRIAAIQEIEPADVVGYGLRYRAETPRRIAVLPIGYGDGYPRVRNRGAVLIHGQRAPVVGGNAMDAMMVDITDIPETKQWDEVVLMGCQGKEEIGVHDLAELKGSVSYDIMTGWSWRLPRRYLDKGI
ncbi:alanine racemase [bacterium]|nr:alanine racemase [bacterium]